ncbi:MAG: hypothetical protein ACK5ZY_04465, partial [Cyclobacteriaceae bacterium]
MKYGETLRLATKCFFNGAVTCSPKFISSFNVWCRGQDAASEAHHSRNTHVVRQCKKTAQPQMAHLVFPNTQANAQKTKRAILCQRTDKTVNKKMK